MFSRAIQGRIFLLVALLQMPAFLKAEMVNGEDLVDPTMPIFGVQGTDTASNSRSVIDRFRTYEVSSILIRPNSRVAIINSQRASIGDRVGDAEIKDIQQGSVTLVVNGETREIRLHQNSIKSLVEMNEG